MNPHLITIEEAYKSNNFVILDTETTGLIYPAEVIQIAVLDFMGDELLNTYVKPKNRIPSEATAIHGITDTTVEDAPNWLDVREHVWELLTNKIVIVYNAEYDHSILNNSDQVWDLRRCWDYHDSDWVCAMKWYAPIAGDWNDYRKSYRWQKLSAACIQNSLPVIDAHDAAGDCKMTFNLITHIMHKRAAERIIYPDDAEQPCDHANKEEWPNGDLVCRDCGKTWTV